MVINYQPISRLFYKLWKPWQTLCDKIVLNMIVYYCSYCCSLNKASSNIIAADNIVKHGNIQTVAWGYEPWIGSYNEVCSPTKQKVLIPLILKLQMLHLSRYLNKFSVIQTSMS
jgi:hypothetical protein